MARGRAFCGRGDLGGVFGAFSAPPSLLRFEGEIVRALDSDLAMEGAWRDVERAWLSALSMAALGVLIC
jgi:hypothetical protein